MGKEQSFSLQEKRTRSVSCASSCCDAIFQIDDLCIKGVGAATIPYDKNYAVEQSFYFCPQRVCISKPPIWTNIAYPKTIVGENVTPEKL